MSEDFKIKHDNVITLIATNDREIDIVNSKIEMYANKIAAFRAANNVASTNKIPIIEQQLGKLNANLNDLNKKNNDLNLQLQEITKTETSSSSKIEEAAQAQNPQSDQDVELLDDIEAEETEIIDEIEEIETPSIHLEDSKDKVINDNNKDTNKWLKSYVENYGPSVDKALTDTANIFQLMRLVDVTYSYYSMPKVPSVLNTDASTTEASNTEVTGATEIDSNVQSPPSVIESSSPPAKVKGSAVRATVKAAELSKFGGEGTKAAIDQHRAEGSYKDAQAIKDAERGRFADLEINFEEKQKALKASNVKPVTSPFKNSNSDSSSNLDSNDKSPSSTLASVSEHDVKLPDATTTSSTVLVNPAIGMGLTVVTKGDLLKFTILEALVLTVNSNIPKMALQNAKETFELSSKFADEIINYAPLILKTTVNIAAITSGFMHIYHSIHDKPYVIAAEIGISAVLYYSLPKIVEYSQEKIWGVDASKFEFSANEPAHELVNHDFRSA